jgi:hypothetical protein
VTDVINLRCGDIVSKTWETKLFVCFYIIFGLTGILYAIKFSNAADYLLTKQLKTIVAATKLHRHGLASEMKAELSGCCR